MNLSLKHARTLIDPEYKHVLEFGVFKGETVRQLRQLFENHFQVFGFDSFKGLPEDWVFKGGNKRIRAGAMNPQAILSVPGVEIFPGWFKDTIPQYLGRAANIALLHVDCDLYSSTKEVLFGLNAQIRSGTIIVFDEWIYNHDAAYDDHEQKAFYDWTTMCNRKFELVDFEDTSNCGEERQIVRIL